MHVKLIYPRDTRPVGADPPLAPPLALGIVAALTPPEVQVTIVDENVQDLDYEEPVDLVGVSMMTMLAGRAYQVADRFRARGVPVVLGGVHPTVMPGEAACHADAVCIGEAEGYWTRLLADFRRGELQPVYRNETFAQPLQIPIARRDLFKNNRYIMPNTIETSRGCPFSCEFCSVPIFYGRTYRFRPIGDVIAEIESLKSRKPIVFLDDNIAGNFKRARDLFRALVPLRVRWLGLASINIAEDEELLDLAARSGCIALHIGFESLSQESVLDMGKRVNVRARLDLVERYRQAIARIHAHNIAVEGSFLFGMDGDDEHVFEHALRFAQHSRLELAHFFILTPLPGTPLFQRLDEQERIVDKDWSHYEMGHVIFEPALHLSDGQSPVKMLRDGIVWAWREFYSLKSIVRRIRWFSKWSIFLFLLNLVYRKFIPQPEVDQTTG